MWELAICNLGIRLKSFWWENWELENISMVIERKLGQRCDTSTLGVIAGRCRLKRGTIVSATRVAACWGIVFSNELAYCARLPHKIHLCYPFPLFFVSPAYLGEYTATLMQIGFFASPYFSVFSNVACTSQIEILNGARSIRVRNMHPTANCFIWQSEKMQDQFFRILPTQNTASLLVCHRRDISTFINNLMI